MATVSKQTHMCVHTHRDAQAHAKIFFKSYQNVILNQFHLKINKLTDTHMQVKVRFDHKHA